MRQNGAQTAVSTHGATASTPTPAAGTVSRETGCPTPQRMKREMDL
ncbi:MAG: hypothetical protein ACP5RN_14220 [Armatimonadota bacterium]